MVKLQKTLILVVHGIGEQSPGETVDALTGGAVKELGLSGPIEGRTEMIAEQVEGSEQLNLFPCTIRRSVIKADKVDNLTEDQEVMAGEVYWSDLSRAPSGAVGTALDLLLTTLGLGYLALENVDYNKSSISACSRTGVYTFVWIFFALIAPLNAMMLIASLALLADDRLLSIGLGPGKWAGSLVMAGLGLIVAVICLIWFKRRLGPRKPYMLRAFVAGLGAIATALMVVSAVVLAGERLDWLWLEDLKLLTCNSTRYVACFRPDYEDVALLAWLAVNSVALIWLVAVCFLLLLFVTNMPSHIGGSRTLALLGVMALVILVTQVLAVAQWRWLLFGAVLLLTLWLSFSPKARTALSQRSRRITEAFAERDLIYLSICNAMLIMWMLISAALWSLFSGMVKAVGGANADEQMIGPGGLSAAAFRDPNLMTMIYDDYSDLPTSILFYVLLAVAALVVIGAIPVAIRMINRDKLAGEQITNLDVWCGRLILNPVLNLLLFFLVLWIAFGGLFQAIVTVMTLTGRAYQDGATGLVFILNEGRGATGGSLLSQLSVFHSAMTGHNELAIGICAVLGAAIYRWWGFLASALGIARDISVYSTRTHCAKPEGPMPERPGHDTRSRYAQRERILNRFRLTHDHLAQQMDYDRLIVVAHSLGTVIAAQSLTAPDLPDRPRFLLTLGSPLTHIYGQYFPKGFDIQPLTGRVARWINIYRCDDFVGTRVRAPGGSVENLRVAPNGHTGYWTDRNVWAALRRALSEPPADSVSDRDSPAGPLVA